MANIDDHAPGTFCWVELGTTDQDAAKAFYGSLFGWSPQDFPMGADGVYTMFGLEGRNAAAAYQLNQEMLSHGVPPHWMLYVAVANADETAAKAAAAGGQVVKGPFDVFTFGRMAVIQDPTGAHFCVWQPMMHRGTGIAGVPGTLCWADLSTGEVERAQKFYTDVFGWRIARGDDGNDYLHIWNGEQPIGGIPPAKYKPAEAPPDWLLYYYVIDCNASTAAVEELGGRVHAGPMDIEKVGRMSVVADPQGAVFALFQPFPRS